MTNTPNVLVILADEQQPGAMGCAGHPMIQTPHLDALAARGTRFTKAWTPSPICVPARASLATGTWVHQNDAWDSAQAYDGEPRSWMHQVRDAGHDVVSFGKLHHRSAADDDGFADRVAPMFIVGGVGWVQGLARTDPLPYDEEAAELAAEVGVGHTPYTRYDDRVADRAADWLRERSAEDAPWAAFISFVAPHYPLSAPEEFSDLYPLTDIAPPRHGRRQEHDAVEDMAKFFSYGDYFDATTTLEARRAYYALCTWVDFNVGRILTALEASGCAEDTVIIYASDHGEMLGERGLWCKSFMFEDSVGIPMIVAGPAVPVGVDDQTSVSLIDVAATVSSVMALDPVGEGTSLVELATKPDPDRLGFSEYHDGGSITGSFALRHGPWKYVEHVGFAPQLFHLEDDPDELHDRGTDPSCAAQLAQCRDALRSICDPEHVNARAFASQAELIDRLGGRPGLGDAFRFNATPVPTD